MPLCFSIFDIVLPDRHLVHFVIYEVGGEKTCEALRIAWSDYL